MRGCVPRGEAVSPWELAKGGRSINIGPNGIDGKIRMEPGPEVKDTLRRIVAMAKHCEGFSTEVLEAGPDMAELVRDWKPDLPEAPAEKPNLRAMTYPEIKAALFAHGRREQGLILCLRDIYEAEDVPGGTP